MTKNSEVRNSFDSAAEAYDESRRQLVPCFDEFYSTMLKMIPFPQDAALRVLDLGAGTGLAAGMVLKAWPNSHAILTDLSGEMLSKAAERLTEFGNRVQYRVLDYSREELPGDMDLVVSALSIHHLPGQEKHTLFEHIYQCLKPGGFFINADHVEAPTPRLFEVYRKLWIQSAREAGVEENVLAEALERTKLDRLSTLNDQLRWLKDAGFLEADCYYKWYHFAVFGGLK